MQCSQKEYTEYAEFFGRRSDGNCSPVLCVLLRNGFRWLGSCLLSVFHSCCDLSILFANDLLLFVCAGTYLVSRGPENWPSGHLGVVSDVTRKVGVYVYVEGVAHISGNGQFGDLRG